VLIRPFFSLWSAAWIIRRNRSSFHFLICFPIKFQNARARKLFETAIQIKMGGGGDWRIAHHIWVEKQKIGHTFVLCFLKSLLIWVSYCLQRVIVSRFSRAGKVGKKERKNERKWFTTDVITVVTPMASNEWRRRRVFFCFLHLPAELPRLWHFQFSLSCVSLWRDLISNWI
jgi:hypothetical protein